MLCRYMRVRDSLRQQDPLQRLGQPRKPMAGLNPILLGSASFVVQDFANWRNVANLVHKHLHSFQRDAIGIEIAMYLQGLAPGAS